MASANESASVTHHAKWVTFFPDFVVADDVSISGIIVIPCFV
jgi:hypothetical protein